MNFSRDEEEEVRRLKQKIQQQDVRISTLDAEGKKRIEEMKLLRTDCNDLKRKLDKEVDGASTLEDNLKKATEEKENCKMVNENLQKRLDELETQLQGKDKKTRMQSMDQDRINHMLLQAEEKFNEESAKRLKLELQISEMQNTSVIHSLQHGADRGRNSLGMEAKITALQKENAILKAEAARQEGSTSNLASPSSLAIAKRMRRSRSSSANGSDIATQQLRDLVDESNSKINQLETRLAKAEREKNKAYNEQIAAEKASTATIAALKESVAETKDELHFQRENIVKALQEENAELQTQCSRIPILEHELKNCRSDYSVLQSKLDDRDEEVRRLQGEVKVLKSQITSAIDENTGLRRDLSAAGEIAKRLQQKEKEVEIARRRVTKLTVSIRRILRGLGDRSLHIGDETFNAAGVSLVGNESSVFNGTILQGFEADLIDELEQLLSSIDEADRCVEFAKVERIMQAKNAQAEVDELGKKLEASETTIASLRDDLKERTTALDDSQTNLSLLGEEKEKVQASLDQVEAKVSELKARVECLEKQVSTSEKSVEQYKFELTASEKECRSLEERLNDLENDLTQRTEQSQAEIEQLKDEGRVIKEELKVSLKEMSSLRRLNDDYLNRCENLSNMIEERHKEKSILEGQLQKTEEELNEARSSITILSLREATLDSDMYALRIELQEELKAASRREVEILSNGLKVLQSEREQWEHIVLEAHLQIEKMTSQAVLSQEEKRREMEEGDRQIESLKQEHIKTKGLLDGALMEVENIQLDLQESKMNRQLAEDALARLFPNAKETDVTVLGDFSCADMTQLYHNESNITLKEWESRLKMLTEEAAAARKDALRWKQESQKQEGELQKEIATVQEYDDKINQLQQQLEQSERSQQETQNSMQKMQEELDVRMISLQKMQLTLDTSEEAMLEMQRSAQEANDEKDKLNVQQEASQRHTAGEIDSLTREIESKKQECGMLKTELDRLLQASVELQSQYDLAITSRKTTESKCANLELTCEEYEKMQEESEGKISSLQESVTICQKDLTKQAEQTQAIVDELNDARKGYEMLKKQLEARNVEYWETKEELAEWQERFERSQADLKIKDELEERLREAEERVEEMRVEVDGLKEKCRLLDEQAITSRREKEESFSRLTALTEELHENRKLAAALSETRQQLEDSVALIEQLEYDLAQKAQECEDADDKELALRKDNKRLAAKMATLQVKIDKLQHASPVTTSQSITSLNSTKIATPERKLEEETLPSSASRKRRAPEDEQLQIKEVETSALTRAIYAPKPSSSIVPRTANKPLNNHHSTQEAVKKISQSPSDIIVKRLKSPQKASLSDRTNLLQPRQHIVSTNKPNGDSQHFMAKLNRYRAPNTIPLQNQ